MFEYLDVSGLDAGAALGVVEQAQVLKRRAEVQEALAILRVVHTYRHQIPTGKVQLGGEGTGLVDDFACLELAAALHRSVDSVTPQVVELVNLEVRLPRLWEVTIACGVPVWLARRIARVTGDLSVRRALWVDATIAPFVTRLAPGRLLRFVDALVVQADPAAAEARWAARNSTRVEIGVMGRDGLRDIYGWLTAADATYLDAALEQLSTILAGQGSAETAAERRATALGILATPARALALIQHSLHQPALTDELAVRPEPDGMGPEPGRTVAVADRMVPERGEGPQPHAGHGPRSPFGCAGHTCGAVTVPPDRLLPKATLVIHLSDDTLTTGVGVGRCEQLGPLTIEQIRQLLGHSRVVVRPVFNPNGIIGVDDYEIPAAIRRAVLQRHRYEVFPYGSRTTTGLDLDHTRPYRWGQGWTPGQTDPDNLGPLRRKSHRAKTHAGWRLTQHEPGQFTWTSPLGRRYVVTTAGLTNDYRHAPGSQPWDNPLGGPLLPDPPRARPRRKRSRPSGAASSRMAGPRPQVRLRP
ncbi:MAG TPA: DUF222 domain-containing protein [Propionicimonas sp.]|uniref:DUF222 domain-containing protein n=1 Tax=Propionicimonas sp. TaxID=1955623 RepID=UPI002F427B63